MKLGPVLYIPFNQGCMIKNQFNTFYKELPLQEI